MTKREAPHPGKFLSHGTRDRHLCLADSIDRTSPDSASPAQRADALRCGGFAAVRSPHVLPNGRLPKSSFDKEAAKFFIRCGCIASPSRERQ